MAIKPRLLFLVLIPFSVFGQINLFQFNSSTCDQDEDPSRLRTRIIDKNLTDNLLTVHIAAHATCCVDFVPKIEVKNGVLYLDIEETGELCECACCYEFIYKISGIQNEGIPILFRNKEIKFSPEKYLIFPIRYDIHKGDTVNFIDKHNFKQGKWIILKDSLVYTLYSFDWPYKRVRLYPNKMIKSETINEKIKFLWKGIEYYTHGENNKYVEYYESGQTKKECYNSFKGWSNNYKEGKCKEWNEKGELVYEGAYRD
jgi:hypothetical protein